MSRFLQIEDGATEYKLAAGGLPRDVWSTISAFANTGGGKIVLGVKERSGSRFSVEGVANPDQVLKTLWDGLRNPSQISFCSCRGDDVHVVDHEGRKLIEITVPPAPRRARPVFIKGNPHTGTFVRRESGDYRCTPDEVSRMLREASGESPDLEVLRDYTIEDLDPATLRSYRQRFQNRDPANPMNSVEDQAFLQHIGAFRLDRTSRAEGITVAGLLMFGTETAIRDWRSRHLIDYRRLPENNDDEERWIDRVAWSGNLLGAFDTILPRLEKDLAAPFRLQGAERMEGSPLQPVLREALVNLLVHADYHETQASLIQRGATGFLFRNPGSSRVARDLILQGDRSDPRNPQLVTMFRLLGYAEEAGTGIPKILRTWKALGFQIPNIIVDTGSYEFELELRYVHLLSQTDREWLASIGPEWPADEQVALVLARHGGFVDNATLRDRTGLHATDAGKILTGLRDRRFLNLRGAGTSARYYLGDAALPAESPSQSITQALRPALEEIARPIATRKRLPSGFDEERDRIVVELCRRVPLSLDDLAELLNRTEAYVGDLVRVLRKAGRLDYMYPDQPTHPEQKYVSTESTSD